MISQSQSISGFVDKLIEEKKIQDLDSEVLLQIKSDLMDRMEERINATILENIPSEKIEEFSDLLDGSSAEDIQLYCRRNIPNLDEVIAQALLEFRNTYLSN